MRSSFNDDIGVPTFQNVKIGVNEPELEIKEVERDNKDLSCSLNFL